MNECVEIWDVVVVGGGVAGLSAALTLGRACRRVLIVDAGEPRNRFAQHMHGVLGHEGLEPAELLERGRAEVGAHEVTIRPGAVVSVVEGGGALTVGLADGSTQLARALVAASGAVDELPDLPGLAEQWGSGVLHCPYCHGWELRGGRVAVLGGGPLALHQVELLRQWTDRLTHLALEEPSPEDRMRLASRGIDVVTTPVVEVLTEDGQLVGVGLADGGRVELDALFISPIPRPHDGYLDALSLERVRYPAGSFIRVDPNTGATSHPRVWAVGNVVNPPANVAVSIGAGAAAGVAVNTALVSEDFDRTVAGG